MSATIIQIDPEIRTAIEEKRLTKIDITEAQLKLADGVLSLKASDLLPPKIKTKDEVEQAKTNKERQREFVQRKQDTGFKKDWLHQSVAVLAEEAGGQENIAVFIEHLRKRAESAEAEVARLKNRKFWQFWR